MPKNEPLTAAEEMLWRALMRIVIVLPRLLDRDMLRTTGLTANEYTTLMNLSEAPKRELRMADLANVAGLSASRMTRLVDDLQSRNLVAKRPSAIDGRGNVAKLTPQGLAKLRSAWLAHLTTYLYTGMWTEGAPAVTMLIPCCVPFAAGLLAWPFVRARRHAVLAFVISALCVRGWVIGDYIPASSESWSQRTALRTYFEQRGPDDRLVSWWFYYRGETFFSKADIWVMKDPDKKTSITELVDEYRGRGATLWFITTVQHTNRLGSHLPPDVRRNIEPVYANFHYSLSKVQIP